MSRAGEPDRPPLKFGAIPDMEPSRGCGNAVGYIDPGTEGAAGEELPETTVRARSLATMTNRIDCGAGRTLFTLGFTRTFTLAGSPAGWNVWMVCDLFGQLVANNPAVGTSASVTARAFIHGTPIECEEIALTVTNTGDDPPLTDLPRRPSGMLSDGTYLAVGRLSTEASRTGGAGGFHSATSDFFTPEHFEGDGRPFGYEVMVNARPIPEPATMLLLGTGLAGIGAASRRKRRPPTTD